MAQTLILSETAPVLSEAHQQQLILANPLPLEGAPVAVYLAGLSVSSRRTMAGALATLAELLTGQVDPHYVAWHQLRFQHIKLLRTTLAERLAPSTANRHLAALRGVLKAALKLHLMDVIAGQDALDEATTIKGSRVPKGRSLSSGEILALMNSCVADQTAAGVRDAAIIGLLYGCGLRRSELVALEVESFKPVDSSIVIRGKGNKERTLYVQSGAREALTDWLAIRGERPGALFWRIRRGGYIIRERLTPQAVLDILTRRRRQAGVARFSPHDLRRTLAGDLLDAGEDIVTVQKILGHSDPTTTAQYDRRPEEAKRKAQAKIHVPYTSCQLVRQPNEERVGGYSLTGMMRTGDYKSRRLMSSSSRGKGWAGQTLMGSVPPHEITDILYRGLVLHRLGSGCLAE
jgi:site-specific recombinase XerD